MITAKHAAGRLSYAALLPDGVYRVSPGSPQPYCEARVIADAGRLLGLSPGEVNVLVLLHDGASVPRIARALELPERAIRRHVQAIKRKLGARLLIHCATRWQAAVDACLARPQGN